MNTTGRDTGAMDVELLHKIDSHLDSKEVAAIKFLCCDLIPRKHLQNVRDGRDIFVRLEEQGLLGDNGLIVAELLLTIQRCDLLRLLDHTRASVQQTLSNLGDSYSGIRPYRKMLYKLSEDVTEEQLHTFKFLLKFPRGKLPSSASFLDVLVEMEKQGVLGEDHLEKLQEVCACVDKQLAMRVQRYAAQRAGGSSSHPVPAQETVDRNRYPLSVSEESTAQQPSQPRPSHNAPVPESSGGSVPVHNEISMDAGPERSSEELFYHMVHRPRGHCLIINNHNFEEARWKNHKVRLGDRNGTDIDVAALTRTFTQLHFTVHCRRDVTGEGLLEVARQFGAMDHGELDAFVCCVLSHGKKGHVYGTDGDAVLIRKITLPFTSSACPSLASKPKLFFIQACQAQEPEKEEEEEEEAVQADGERDQCDTRAGCSLNDTIPDDSDFLLGMATVEDRTSFRHTVRGSLFIQVLCTQLERGSQRNDDILTIMTNVNREVSAEDVGRRRQMPQPRYTLTKKLILPLE